MSCPLFKGDLVSSVATVAAVVMPMFNIPLIVKIIKRKSSADLSLAWALGVWVCILLMTPQALRSQDISYKAFGSVNLIFFSAVTFFILKYRRKS